MSRGGNCLGRWLAAWVWRRWLRSWGTTLCAAAKVGRRARGIELDPVYADVALRRVQEETGEIAMLDGVSFTDVATARVDEGRKNA